MDSKISERSKEIARHAGHGVEGVQGRSMTVGWSLQLYVIYYAGAKRKTVIRSNKFSIILLYTLCVHVRYNVHLYLEIIILY